MQQLLKKNLFIILILLAIVITIFITNKSKVIDDPASDPVELTLATDDPIVESANEVEAAPEEFMIDVKGEVRQPGVYTVDVNARVIDVITIAGGFTDTADQNQVNLAQKIHDEMVVFIPKPGEIIEGIESIQMVEANQSEGIRLNSATKEEIQSLNGIGPSKAEAIVTYREENGPFKSVDELLNVSGIGEKTLEKFKDEIIVP